MLFRSVKQLDTVFTEDITLLSVFPRDSNEIRELYKAVAASQEFKDFTSEEVPMNLVYIFPGDFFLTAIVTDANRRFSPETTARFPEVLEWHRHKFNGGLGKFFRIFHNYTKMLGKIATDYDVDRLVFVHVENSKGKPSTTDELFAIGKKRRPVLIVDVDSFSHEILAIAKASGQHKWGSVPMPSF